MRSQPGSGSYNSGCVQEIRDWKEFYPAFVKACEDNVGALKNGSSLQWTNSQSSIKLTPATTPTTLRAEQVP
ncbi:MAG: hypothetical protein PUH74_01390 [Bacteroidales bacterium]|nr:hypothetical protein [Bacteroidales bacterium]